MQLPEALLAGWERELSACSVEELRQAAEKITRHYQDGLNSKGLFQQPAARLAYLTVRMPATFAAVEKVLRQCPFRPSRLIDVGAGPGTGAWAAEAVFGPLSVVCVEQSPPMVELGRRLGPRWEWRCQGIEAELPEGDCALLSYLVAELGRAQWEALLQRLWEKVQWIVVVEPGTPAGHQRILQIRHWAMDRGAELVAPCPHRERCPLQAPKWCHFPARVERTRLHKHLKGGTLGYEDEKFSYIVFGKEKLGGPPGRIVGPVIKGSGFVRLPVCTDRGTLEEQIVGRKKEGYRVARDAEWGDCR